MSEKRQEEVINPLAIAKLLGPSNPKLDHLIRFLNSVRGTDKVLMVRIYFSSSNITCTLILFVSLFNTGPKSLFGFFNVVHLLSRQPVQQFH